MTMLQRQCHNVPSPSHKWSPASFNWRCNYHPLGLIHLIPLEVDEKTSQTLLEAVLMSPHLFCQDLSPLRTGVRQEREVWRERVLWGAG